MARGSVLLPEFARIPVRELGPRGESLVSYPSFDTIGEKLLYLQRKALDAGPDIAMRAPLLFGRPTPREIVIGLDDPIAQLRALHDWRMQHVGYHFVDEAFQTPGHVLKTMRGDCSDHATLGAAQAWWLGMSFALVPTGNTETDPSHLSLLVSPSRGLYALVMPWAPLAELVAPKGWMWSDTGAGIGDSRPPLAFGESPLLAFQRAQAGGITS